MINTQACRMGSGHEHATPTLGADDAYAVTNRVQHPQLHYLVHFHYLLASVNKILDVSGSQLKEAL